jgi:hypothetical protein
MERTTISIEKSQLIDLVSRALAQQECDLESIGDRIDPEATSEEKYFLGKAEWMRLNGIA